MRNKKTIALAMTAATVAPMAVPAFAAGVETAAVVTKRVNIDMELAKKDTPEAVAEYDKLMKVKEDLNAKWGAKYYPSEGPTLDNRYEFMDEEGHILNDMDAEEIEKHVLECQTVAGTFVLSVRDKSAENKIDAMTIYTFKGVKTAKPVPPTMVKASIDYRATNAQSRIAELKKAIVENDLDVKVITEGKGSTATYKFVLSQKTGYKFALAEVTVEFAPISWNDEILGDNDKVVLPENSDFSAHWAKDYIEGAMLDRWIVASSEFRPNDSITRAEFVRIVNNAFGIDETTIPVPRGAMADNGVEGGTYFDDVKGGTWFYQDIMAAVNAGYISGYETTVKDENGKQEMIREFRPNAPITRQEAASILGRIYGVKETKDLVTKFADDKDIATWADESVAYLNAYKVVNGYSDNTFRPMNKITRAESVVMLSSALKSNMPIK